MSERTWEKTVIRNVITRKAVETVLVMILITLLWEEICYGNFFNQVFFFVEKNAFIHVEWHFCSAECVESFPCVTVCQSSVMRT